MAEDYGVLNYKYDLNINYKTESEGNVYLLDAHPKLLEHFSKHQLHEKHQRGEIFFRFYPAKASPKLRRTARYKVSVERAVPQDGYREPSWDSFWPFYNKSLGYRGRTLDHVQGEFSFVKNGIKTTVRGIFTRSGPGRNPIQLINPFDSDDRRTLYTTEYSGPWELIVY